MSSMIPPKNDRPPTHLRGFDDYQERYRRSLEDPDGFWLDEAKALSWFHPPTQAGRWVDRPEFEREIHPVQPVPS